MSINITTDDVWNPNDIEEDELDSESESGDDVQDSGSDSDDDNQSNTDNDYNLKKHENDENENYIRFVKSVFCDDNKSITSNSSIDDDVDDDDFHDSDDYSDDDSDDDDDDYDGNSNSNLSESKQVSNKELQELVDGCWQTIAGEIPISLVDSENNTKKKIVTKGITGSNNNTSDLSDSPNRTSNNNIELLNHPKGQSLITTLVTQLFSGGKLSEVCVEGMPIDTIRKLVARQMSMSLQLLLQMLLYSENHSTCFNTSYTHLMELSNYRESSIKKIELMKINIQNVTSYQNFLNQNNMLTNTSNNNIVSHVNEKRLTRGGINRYFNTSGEITRTTSIFDVPALSQVSILFDLIDDSRSNILAETSLEQIHSNENSNSNSSNAPFNKNNNSNKKSIKRKNNDMHSRDDLTNLRITKLNSIKQQVVKIWGKLNMRIWTCLLPSSSFPLSLEINKRNDPSSLSGRSFFTPAEDDLLLRGIISVNDNGLLWKNIKSSYLPSKEEQLLQFRFTQMTSITASEDTKFKRYLKLEEERRMRDWSWTLEEDIALLRGFQIYGNKWALISIFCIPHRQRKDINHRWQTLLKLFTKASQENDINIASISTVTGHEGNDNDLSPQLKSFYHFLNQPIQNDKDKINENEKVLSNNKNKSSIINNNISRSINTNNSNSSSNRNIDNISNATNYSTFNSKTKPYNQIGLVPNKSNLYKSQEYYNNKDDHVNLIQNTEFLRIQNSIKQQKLLSQQQNMHNANFISNTNMETQLNSSSLYLHNSNSQLNNNNNNNNRMNKRAVALNNNSVRNNSINESNLYSNPIDQLNIQLDNQSNEYELKTDNNDKESLLSFDSGSDIYYDHKANEMSVVQDDVSNFSNFEKMLGSALLASRWQASNISSAVPLHNTNSVIGGFQSDLELQHNMNNNSIRNSIKDINHNNNQDKEVYINNNSLKRRRDIYENKNSIEHIGDDNGHISDDNGSDEDENENNFNGTNSNFSNTNNNSSIGLFASVMANINKK